MDKACDVSLGRFSGELSSKYQKELCLTIHMAAGKRLKTSGGGQEYNVWIGLVTCLWVGFQGAELKNTYMNCV